MPKAGGTAYDDVEQFTLLDILAEGPIILAFYPAAFTGGCRKEICTFSAQILAIDDLGAKVYGVRVDLPFAQNEWIQAENLEISMLSDRNHEVIRQYEVVQEDVFGHFETAQRSVFVVDRTEAVTFHWVQQDESADFEDFVTTTRDAVAAIDK